MNLAATTAAEGQAEAEALMVDTCVIDHVTGQPTDDAGRVVDTYTLRYEGPCRMRTRAGSREPREAGAQIVSLLTRELHVPMSAPGAKVKDRVRYTATGPGSDPDLLDRVFHIDEPDGQTYQTARRYPCTEVTA